MKPRKAGPIPSQTPLFLPLVTCAHTFVCRTGRPRVLSRPLDSPCHTIPVMATCKGVDNLKADINSGIVTGGGDDDDDLIIAIDSTGTSVTNRGHQWMSDKWGGLRQKEERPSQNPRCCERKDRRNPCLGGY